MTLEAAYNLHENFFYDITVYDGKIYIEYSKNE